MNTLFYRTFTVAAPESFNFPACNFIIKETTAKMFFCEFWKIFKDIPSSYASYCEFREEMQNIPNACDNWGIDII